MCPLRDARSGLKVVLWPPANAVVPMVRGGRRLAGRWGSRRGPFIVSLSRTRTRFRFPWWSPRAAACPTGTQEQGDGKGHAGRILRRGTDHCQGRGDRHRQGGTGVLRAATRGGRTQETPAGGVHAFD